LGERTRARLDALDARSSLYAKHLPSGREIAVRADLPMNALSVIKIPIMVLAYRDAEAGRLDLDARHRVTPDELRRGSGLLQTFAPGLEPTYRDLITQMIITSDNSATDIMIEKLGRERVNELLEGLGYTDTRLRTTTGALSSVAFPTIPARRDATSSSKATRLSGSEGRPLVRCRDFWGRFIAANWRRKNHRTR
jgi:beta-lactamase class A